MPPEAPNLPEGHITLKDASRISGYAPDYVGQLIRKGKLYGRQVYWNTAWVTTEAAVREYLARENSPGGGGGMGEGWQRIQNTLFSEARLTRVYQFALWAVLAMSLLLLLFLIYAFSANLDRSLEENAERRATEALAPAR